MNKEYVLYNLLEAREELDRMITVIQKDKSYNYDDYVVDMSQLYHHINIAWNARNESKDSTEECSEENFDRWRQFPDSGELLLRDS